MDYIYIDNWKVIVWLICEVIGYDVIVIPRYTIHILNDNDSH